MSATGTWNLTMKTPIGDQSMALTVSDAGGALTGTLSGSDGVADIKDGTVSGDTLTFKADVKKPMPLTIGFELTAAGDAVTGTAKPGMFPAMPVTGTRAA